MILVVMIHSQTFLHQGPNFEVPKFPMMTSSKFEIAPINVQGIPLQ